MNKRVVYWLQESILELPNGEKEIIALDSEGNWWMNDFCQTWWLIPKDVEESIINGDVLPHEVMVGRETVKVDEWEWNSWYGTVNQRHEYIYQEKPLTFHVWKCQRCSKLRLCSENWIWPVTTFLCQGFDTSWHRKD